MAVPLDQVSDNHVTLPTTQSDTTEEFTKADESGGTGWGEEGGGEGAGEGGGEGWQGREGEAARGGEKEALIWDCEERMVDEAAGGW